MNSNRGVKSKNIILLIDGFGHGGIQQSYLLLINEYLLRFNSVILVIVNQDTRDLIIPKSPKLKVLNLNSKKLIDFRAMLNLRKILKKFNPEFIIANMYRSQIWSAIVFTKPTKLIWVEQNTYIHRTLLQWSLMRILSIKVDKIVCISEEVKIYTDLKLKKNNKTSTLPNPISKTSTFDLSTSRENNFIFVGRMVAQKNPELLIESFSKFRQLYKIESKLHLVGDGELTSSLKQLAQNLNIINQCIFHGWLENQSTLDLMKKCKTLVSTSIIEGMALVRFEALANGCCVVTTNTGGTKQYLLPEAKNGIFLIKSDPSEIAKAMHSSLNNKYWSQELVQNRISISLEFDAPRIADRLIEVNQS